MPAVKTCPMCKGAGKIEEPTEQELRDRQRTVDRRIAGINAYIASRRVGQRNPPKDADAEFMAGWDVGRRVYDP